MKKKEKAVARNCPRSRKILDFSAQSVLFHLYLRYWWKGDLAEKMYMLFSISTFFTFFVIPCACFFFFYGSVALSMHRRKTQSDFGSSRYTF